MNECIGPDNRAGKKLSTQPLYAQLRDILVKRVTSGIWRAGDAIPNENELAREFALSTGTVRRALKLMESARIIVRHQGRGTYVTDPSETKLATRFDTFHKRDGVRLVCDLAQTQITEVGASPEEITTLRLKAEDRVFRVSQIRKLDGRPFMFEHASLPTSLFASLPPRESGYELVRAAMANNVLLGTGEEQISMAPAPADVAVQLMVAASTSVILLERIVYSVEDVPVEMRMAWCMPGQTYYQSAIG